MIEKVLYDYLTTKLEQVAPVYMMRPETPPAKYVLLMRTGGSETEHIYSSTVALQSVAPTLYEAVVLDDAVREQMDASIELDDISVARLTNCYDYTNPATKQPRYQSIYEITHYKGQKL